MNKTTNDYYRATFTLSQADLENSEVLIDAFQQLAREVWGDFDPNQVGFERELPYGYVVYKFMQHFERTPTPEDQGKIVHALTILALENKLQATDRYCMRLPR